VVGVEGSVGVGWTVTVDGSLGLGWTVAVVGSVGVGWTVAVVGSVGVGGTVAVDGSVGGDSTVPVGGSVKVGAIEIVVASDAGTVPEAVAESAVVTEPEAVTEPDAVGRSEAAGASASNPKPSSDGRSEWLLAAAGLIGCAAALISAAVSSPTARHVRQALISSPSLESTLDCWFAPVAWAGPGAHCERPRTRPPREPGTALPRSTRRPETLT